jgi:hypothetical protein
MACTPKHQRKASWQFEDWWEARRFSKWAELLATGWYDSPQEVGSLIYRFLGRRRHALGLYYADQQDQRDQLRWEKHRQPHYRNGNPLHRAYSLKKKRSKRK